ncbi:hypothetical protein AB0G32_07905 [Streptomyces sp. NPDC023723]|uniref:hypothetical protein n=1 Tax=Streptomyces sp. NPDC023723 TaxID=3154323 RepID=UPI0034074085
MPARTVATAGNGNARRSAPPPGPARQRLTGAALIVLAAAAALAGGYVFTTWLPADGTRYREYRAAGVCHDRAVVPAAEDCLRELAFTVEDTEDRPKQKRATLRGPAPFERVAVAFGDSEPVLAELDPGDRVTGTVWRGVVVRVAEGDTRQETSDAPRDELQMNAAFGTFAGLCAALALAFGTVRLVRPRRLGVLTWRPYGKWLLITAGTACGAVGLITVWTGLPWPLVPSVCGAVVAVTAVFLRRDLRRGD